MTILPDNPSDHPDAEALVRRALDLVVSAKSVPLSSSVMISRDEVAELLEEAVARLPDELREARWLLKEREEFLAKARAEAEEIISAARERVEAMVQRTEIARQAKRTARRTIDEAQEEARRLRHEAEDYCDHKLAGFEIVLERTIKTVQSGRERLRVTPLPNAEDAPLAGVDPDSGEHEAFFDQDSS
jgi:cell division septum initiation protein DivIVA